MGRVTYEVLAEAALEHPSDGQDRISELPKMVFSTILNDASWNNSRIASDAAGEVVALKAAGGDPLRTFGSLTIVSALIAADLVDRLRLVVFPQILARTGLQPPFAPLGLDADLDLLTTSVLDDRRIVAEYRPHPRPTDSPNR